MVKRKMRAGPSSASSSRKRRVGQSRVIPGFTQTSGYYGRFATRGGELKFFDTTKVQSVIAAVGNITDLSVNLIPQGVTESTRVGRKCVVKRIHFRGEVRMPDSAASGTTADRLRIIIYQDKQANGATATIASLLETTSIDSFRNLAESGRFRVLLDRNYDVAAQSGSGNGTVDRFGEQKKTFKFNKLCNIPLEFAATTGAITEIRSNNIGVLAISEAGVVTLQYTCRIRFSDN